MTKPPERPASATGEPPAPSKSTKIEPAEQKAEAKPLEIEFETDKFETKWWLYDY
jgi:hypothetical protein